eukprot:scaffold2273_cov178-Chaetoceros_neogracile.AAC.3
MARVRSNHVFVYTQLVARDNRGRRRTMISAIFLRFRFVGILTPNISSDIVRTQCKQQKEADDDAQIVL